VWVDWNLLALLEQLELTGSVMQSQAAAKL
jgi:hypothetical protein